MKQRDLCKTPLFAQFLRLPREMRSLFLWGQAQILILKILNVFLRLKFSPSLNLNKNEHFSKVSPILTAGLLALGIHGFLFSLDFNRPGRPSLENPVPMVLNMTLTSVSQKTASKPALEKKKQVIETPAIVKKSRKQPNTTKQKHILKALPRKTVQIPVQPIINNTPKAMAEDTGETATSDIEPGQDGSKTVSITSEETVTSLSPHETIHEARPIYRSNPSPKYPGIARIRGYQGNVLLDVLVNDDGKVDDVKIFRSSGYPILDRAATSSVKRWLFEPGRVGKEKKDMWVRVPIRFELK